MGHKTVGLNTLCKVWVVCWRNIMAGGSRPHYPCCFGFGACAFFVVANKRYQTARLCLRWFFGGIAHPALDSMFTPNNEWCYEGAGLFIGFK